MKLTDIKKEISKYFYMEDDTILDVAIASIIANRLKINSSPIWLVIIGASSGGKSQILRPLSLTDEKFIHKLDDITENTFLSGMKTTDGSASLLHRIGVHGMLSISDLTVLMSKSAESRGTILSQLRMLFDGEMVKHSGSQKEPITWKGFLGVIAGSTPSIYRTFEEVSDMGERFIYFRMKEIDRHNATRLAMSRSLYGKELDEQLAEYYSKYIKDVILSKDNHHKVKLSEEVIERIINIADFAEKVRTTTQMDWKNERMTRIPVPALPMRVSLQLMSLAETLSIMRHHDNGSYDLSDKDISIIEWVGYSLANEEKRAVLKALASSSFDYKQNTSTVADRVGLYTDVVRNILQNLSAVGIIKRSGGGDELQWSFIDKKHYDYVRKTENIDTEDNTRRETSLEEADELEEAVEQHFANF